MSDIGEIIGQRLDTLGVTAKLRPGDLVSDALVLLQVVEPDGDIRVQVCWSDGMTWLNRRGMLEAARDAERIPPTPRRDDE